MTTEKKQGRGRGRPPKDGKAAMSPAERQKQYRERLRQRAPKKGEPERASRVIFSPFDIEALQGAREEMVSVAKVTSDPRRFLVLEARNAAAGLALRMREWGDAIADGRWGVQRRNAALARAEMAAHEEVLQELEAAFDEQDITASAPSDDHLDIKDFRAALRNIVGEQDAVAGLYDMRMGLLLALSLAKDTIARLHDIKAAVRSGKVDKNTRQAVLAEVQELDRLARSSLQSLVPDTKNPPPWARGQKDWT